MKPIAMPEHCNGLTQADGWRPPGFRGFRLQANARRAFALIATLAAASGVLLGGQTPLQQTPPTFRGSVEAVQLTVIVTDRQGNPVRGLTEDDFEILENRAARPLTTFAAVDIPIEQARQPAPARAVRWPA